MSFMWQIVILGDPVGICVFILVSSVAQSCPTLCDPMDCSTPVLPVHQQLPKFTQTHVCWVGDAIQPSHPVVPSFCPQSFLKSGSFPVSYLFTSGGQSIGVSASASVLSINVQCWFPLGLTGLISLLSKGFSEVLQYHNLKASVLWRSAFFMVSHIHTWLLEKP